MTPVRHQCVQCPLPSTTAVSLPPVTKGHCLAWPSGTASCPGSRKRSEVRCWQEPAAHVYSAAQVSGSHPLISAAAGQRATRGLIKHPAASTHCGPITASGTCCAPRQCWGTRATLERRAIPWRREGGWPFPMAPAVTRAQPRHPPLCGSSLLALKGKSSRDGAATPPP